MLVSLAFSLSVNLFPCPWLRTAECQLSLSLALHSLRTRAASEDSDLRCGAVHKGVDRSRAQAKLVTQQRGFKCCASCAALKASIRSCRADSSCIPQAPHCTSFLSCPCRLCRLKDRTYHLACKMRTQALVSASARWMAICWAAACASHSCPWHPNFPDPPHSPLGSRAAAPQQAVPVSRKKSHLCQNTFSQPS